MAAFYTLKTAGAMSEDVSVSETSSVGQLRQLLADRMKAIPAAVKVRIA